MTLPPLSLYIHFPWCVQKCPYCDFNSHTLRESHPEEAYIQALFTDMADLAPLLNQRPIHSIFMGGGTPSLFSPDAIATLLSRLSDMAEIPKATEITLEANPGTVEQTRFEGYINAGINRLSIGIQSLNTTHLHTLGRIHDAAEASTAVSAAKAAGFTRINTDIMYGLPEQRLDQALEDLDKTIALGPNHISWYQLTLEPNTAFYLKPPALPKHDLIADMATQGAALLAQHDYHRYEISAYGKHKDNCAHNINYWQFGDYLGIGAGAHSKITHPDGSIQRWLRPKHPKAYLTKPCQQLDLKILTADELPFEFMLNALRLTAPQPWSLFEQRTGLVLDVLDKPRKSAEKLGLLHEDPHYLRPTKQGHQFYNDLVELFLEG